MNPEIYKLIERAEDFYSDSEYLIAGKRYEASVNRNYYAMFTMVQALLFTKNIFAKTHQGTQLKFHELYIKTGLFPAELGKLFNETFEKRQFSDLRYGRRNIGSRSFKSAFQYQVFVKYH
jgi:uncharacterized protein (UPF0332 family)